MRLLQTLSLIASVACQQFPIRLESLQQPDLDLSSFNNEEFGILGNFDTVTKYSYIGASDFTDQVSSSNNNSLIFTSNNQFFKIGDIQGGAVESIIPLNQNQFLIIGDFEFIGNYSVVGPLIYNTSSGDITDLNITGVNTALFDDDLIYLGGDFTYNSTQSAAIYNLTEEKLYSTPFRGFGSSSHVNSIISVGSSIIFGGKFDNLGYPQLLSQSYNTSSISVETSQLVSLKYATFSSSDSSDASEVQCPGSSNGWSVSDVTAATLNIDLPLTIIPFKIRLYNSEETASQISLFRLITGPSGSIMNLTYIDPSTGELELCDAWCPLYNSTNLALAAESSDSLSVAYDDNTISFSSSFQEFGFINSLDVSSIIFQALDSYGNSIALFGFQIYQSIFSTYANNTYNEPSCDSAGDYSKSVLEGTWSSADDGYLTTTVSPGDSAGVVFYPNITYAGEYTILLYTPGCSSDASCAYRGVVNASIIYDDTDELIASYSIYQTNSELKYDSMYSGNLTGGVRIEMMYDSELSGTGSVELVAYKVDTTIISIDDLVSSNGSIPINGIFEYSPSNFTQLNTANLTETILIGNTTINTLGGDLSENAEVFLAYFNDEIIVAGDFDSDSYGDNFLRISVDEDDSTDEAVSAKLESVDGGLNGAVSALYTVDAGVIIIGSFDNTNDDATINSLGDASTSSISNVALFNSSWYSFPSQITNSTFTDIIINGTEYWVFGTDKWIVESNSLFTDNLLLSFDAMASGSQSSDTLFAGSLRYADSIANNGSLTNGANFKNITSDSLDGSIQTGLFINSSLSVFGGDFTISDFSNLLFVQDNSSFGIDRAWISDSFISKLFAIDGNLFIGSGIEGGKSLDGVLIYNLNTSSFIDNQPSDLASNTSSIIVNEFGILNNTYLIVGGEFTSAGNVSCSGLCFYNLNESSWESLIDSFSGSVTGFRFINNTLVISGDLNYDGSDYYLFAYDFNSTKQSEQPDAFDSINQSVNSFILVDNSTTGRIIVTNEYSISAYDGSNWSNITTFENDSIISDISLFEINDSNDSNDEKFFNSNQLLFASGYLQLKTYGYSNIAYYNGSEWVPYLITTDGTSTSTASSIFMNKDISSLFQSGSISSQTSQTSESPSPSSSSSPKEKSGKMDRGFIVLVSLAVAVGTVSLLGGLAAFILYKKRSHDYTPLEPRVNETEMLDTVPPENLLKHI